MRCTPYLGSARAGAMALALCVLLPCVLGAQPRTPHSRLAGRLNDATREAVMAVVDSATVQSLPADVLVTRALEGASKRATDARILGAVRGLFAALQGSRQALGRDATPAEVAAGASAIQANVPPQSLASLRRQRPAASMTVPLSVLTDLIVRGVPVDTATRTVLALAREDDRVLVAFRRDVERDISVGAMPAAAASLRAASFMSDATAESARAGSPSSPTPAQPLPPPPLRKP